MSVIRGYYNSTPPSIGEGGVSPLQLSASGLLLISNGDLVRKTAEFTRPSDTTQYAIGDSVGPVTTPAPMEFTNAARATGGGGRVIAGRISKSADAVTGATFRLHLYNATVTPEADNAALVLTYANRAKYVGYIDFGTMLDFGSYNASPATLPVPGELPYICAATSLFGILAALGTYTPTSAETFSVDLWLRRD